MFTKLVKSLLVSFLVLLCMVAAITAISASAPSFYPVLSFGPGGSGTIAAYANSGNHALNSSTDAIDITYASYESLGGSHYSVKLRFNKSGMMSDDYKYMRIQYSLTNPSGVSSTNIYAHNDASGLGVVIVPNAVTTNGFVISDTFAMTSGYALKFPSRLGSGAHMSFYTDCTVSGGQLSIKAIYFFPTEEEADSFVPYNAITFGTSGNAAFSSGYAYGEYTVDEYEGSVDISYSDFSKNYMAKIKFADANDYSTAYKYMRVLYNLYNPAGVTSTNLYVRNDASGVDELLASNVKDTNGYVLTDTFKMPDNYPDRLESLGHFSFTTSCTKAGGMFSIKGIYFFTSKADADKFVLPTSDREIYINGNNIKNYKIVVPQNSNKEVYSAAAIIAKQIRALNGAIVPVITDCDFEESYEILVGRTNREASVTYMDSLLASGANHTIYCGTMVGNKPVVTSYAAAATKNAAEYFASTYLYKGNGNVPSTVNITSVTPFSGTTTVVSPYEVYDAAVNVSDPTVFTEDFTEDRGYFTEENGATLWKYKNGALSYSGANYSVSYVHVYEANVSETVTLSYSSASELGNMGLIARYAADAAYIKAGYDFRKSEWYIEYREGIDLYLFRAASVTAFIDPYTEYTLNLTVNGNNATLSVNGSTVLNCTVPHVTPGRIGIYSDGVTLTADNYEAVLLSGEGVIMRNAVHNLIPVDEFREGGSVMVLSDNTWIYENHRSTTFKSLDNGKTWQPRESWVGKYFSYVNIFRLASGRFIQMAQRTVNGVDSVYVRYSDNEGTTWKTGGTVCPVYHPTYGIGGGNMNDKITQSAKTGRIFYSISYDNRGDATTKRVFCDYYYSDDNGITWNKSNMSSRDIDMRALGIDGVTTGNDLQFFGENKLIECDDGTIRVYCSWSRTGKIMYADSTDGGLNFGPVQILEGFTSSHASMQLVRDPYGPTDTTYYMVWVNNDNCDPDRDLTHPIRSRLSLAYSIDGKNWNYVGDIWRWECRWRGGLESICLSHLVDPFINVTEDYIVCGSGISEMAGPDYHNEQRQHIWSIEKSTLKGIWLPEMMPDADSDGQTTLEDFTILNKCFAKWIGYDGDVYDLTKFDLNGDGAVNPLDSVILARHLAGWNGYKVIPLNYQSLK